MFLDDNLADMTESVSTPRPRSRSTRSSARSRQRSAAAAGSTSARATARSGSAPAGDVPRDERTLDLFGDPVLEPGERMPVAARDDAIGEADAAGADDGRQATLDGFIAPEPEIAAGHAAAEGAAQPEGGGAAESMSTPEGGLAANVDGPSADGGAMKSADLPAADGAEKAAATLQAAAGAAAKAAESPAAEAEVAKPAAEAVAVKSREGKFSGEAVRERRPSSGGKRRAAAGASETAAKQSAPAATRVDAAPEAAEANRSPDIATAPVASPMPVEAAEPASITNSATAKEAAAQPDVPQPPVTQPVASVASFVTKPSSERAHPAAPAFDPDTHLRPLTDRLAVLQSDVDGVTRAADREMRRVNRLLLALAVVVLAGLVALVMQTRQIAHLKQDAAAKQQRIDRLAADLSTQQATLMTLEEHHEALLSQVDRLQRTANREAAVAKRTRRTR